MNSFVAAARTKLKKSGLWVGVIVGLAATGLLYTENVSAVSDIAPDPGDYTAANDVWLEVSKYNALINGLNAPTSTVTIYSTVPNPIITIYNPHFCSGVSPDSPGGYTLKHTSFVFSGGEPTYPTGSNSGYATSTCDGNTWVTQMNNLPKASEAEGLEGYYKTTLTATIITALAQVNAFKVQTNSGFVSYTSSSGDKFALQRRGTDGSSEFNLYFATPCTVSGETAYLRWFDADQDNYDQTPANYGFYLKERQRGSSDPWQEVSQVSSFAQLGGNNVAKDMSFWAEGDKEYRWQWYGVARKNGIQFQVPYDSIFSKISCNLEYSAEPILTVDSAPITQSGAEVKITPKIKVSTNKTDKLDWRLVTFVLRPGVSPKPTNPDSDDTACDYHSYAAGQLYKACELVSSQDDTAYAVSATPAELEPQRTVTVGNYPVGAKVCFSLSINRFNQDVGDDDWYHGIPVCFTVAKVPSAQIWGNDLRVGSGSTVAQANSAARVTGTATSFPDGFYGTWSEYGVLAPSQVLGVSSGSGIVANKVNTQSQWSRLTFANNGVYGQFTNGASLGIFPAIKTYLVDSGINLGAVPLDERVTAVTVNAFSHKVLSTTDTVTITSDIINDDGAVLAGEQQIPQMIIIANNINIQSNVSRVDAWLIAAGGTVNTCADKSLPLVVGDCSTVLRVNGPVVARQLLLRRTGGDNGNAAEIFNLRSDAYLWAHNISKQNARWETTSTSELPPRY